MCDTHSSSLGMVGTSLGAASLHCCAMCDANSSLLDLVGTSLEAASLQLCAMGDTHSSLNDLVDTSHNVAFHPLLLRLFFLAIGIFFFSLEKFKC